MLKAADLFCGAGGTTTGANASGCVKVTLAVNHWRVAVQTHSNNHQDVRHVCAEIDMIDPRDFLNMKLDVLMASPECVFHSNARGGKPVDDQRRATAWCVPRWAEVLRPKWIVIENVCEFEKWAPLGSDLKPLKSKEGEIFDAWVNALRALNYHVEWKRLNSADYGGATKRIRLFIVCRLGPSRQPIPWPKPTHAKENWAPAASIINWATPCPSIFTRKKPLAENTLRRITIGLRKFCGQGIERFVVTMRRNANAHGIDDPLGTITCGGGHHALAMPFQFKWTGRSPGLTKSITDPMPTILGAAQNHAIVVPFVTSYHNGTHGCNRSSSAGEPLPVIDTNPRHAIVQPYLIDVHHGSGDGRSSSVDSPLPTIVTKPGNSLVTPFVMGTGHTGTTGRAQYVYDPEEPLRTVTTREEHSLVLPFLTEYFGTGGARSIDDPLSTVTTKPRHGLAMVELLKTMEELKVIDIGFRMLDVAELAAAQGFPAGYQIFGSKAEQIKQIGNSVHTHVARALCEAIGGAA